MPILPRDTGPFVMISVPEEAVKKKKNRPGRQLRERRKRREQAEGGEVHTQLREVERLARFLRTKSVTAEMQKAAAESLRLLEAVVPTPESSRPTGVEPADTRSSEA